MASSRQKLNLRGVCEVKFFNRTNHLDARAKIRVAAQLFLLSKMFISNTLLKTQFWLLGVIFGSKFANITDRENANMYYPIFLLLKFLTCGVVDLRSSDALRRETEYDYAQ